nr:MAG TPA: hypothetical protein [Caudoviricetes sp.]
MSTSTIITCIIVGIVFLVVWALVITTFIRMIGKVDDNIIRMIYKSEFVPVPTVPTAVDNTETDDVEVEDTEDEIEDNGVSGT